MIFEIRKQDMTRMLNQLKVDVGNLADVSSISPGVGPFCRLESKNSRLTQTLITVRVIRCV